MHQEERSWPTEAVIRSEHKRTMGARQMQLDEKKTQWTPYRAAHMFAGMNAWTENLMETC